MKTNTEKAGGKKTPVRREITPEERKILRAHKWKSVLWFIAAALFYSIGVSFFFGPSGLTPGGLSGIAIASLTAPSYTLPGQKTSVHRLLQVS